MKKALRLLDKAYDLRDGKLGYCAIRSAIRGAFGVSVRLVDSSAVARADSGRPDKALALLTAAQSPATLKTPSPGAPDPSSGLAGCLAG